MLLSKLPIVDVRFDSIAVFGDSWCWGDELVDPNITDATPDLEPNTAYRESQCFAGIIGRHYRVPVENLSIPGGSLQSTVWNYIWWRNNRSNHDRTLVLVGLTDPARISWYNPKHVSYANDAPWNRYVHSAWAAHTDCYSNDWRDLFKRNLVLTDSPELHRLNYQQSLMFFDGQTRDQSLLQFNVLSSYAEYRAESLLWPGSNLREFLKYHTNCWAPRRHPNERGHQIIADILISHIESAIITRC